MKTKVNIQPAIDALIKKTAADKQNLTELLNSPESVEDFDAQQDALALYQGDVRALYVLAGKTTLDGVKIVKTQTDEASLRVESVSAMEAHMRDLLKR